MIGRVALLFALAACSHQEAGERHYLSTLDVPEILQTCPKGGDAPSPPPPPRTVEQVVAWAVALNAAGEKTEKARAECAYRLKRLNDWIQANQVVPGNVPLTAD